MEKIQEPKCNICGDETTLRYVKSSGMDIEPTGLFADCVRCGNSQLVKTSKEFYREKFVLDDEQEFKEKADNNDLTNI